MTPEKIPTLVRTCPGKANKKKAGIWEKISSLKIFCSSFSQSIHLQDSPSNKGEEQRYERRIRILKQGSRMVLLQICFLSESSLRTKNQNPDEGDFERKHFFSLWGVGKTTFHWSKEPFEAICPTNWGVYLIWKCFWIFVLGSGSASESEEKATLECESGIFLLLKMALTKN